jgi:hypothetical protein
MPAASMAPLALQERLCVDKLHSREHEQDTVRKVKVEFVRLFFEGRGVMKSTQTTRY